MGYRLAAIWASGSRIATSADCYRWTGPRLGLGFSLMGCRHSELQVVDCRRDPLRVRAASSRLVAGKAGHGWNLTRMRICWILSSSPDSQQDFAATFSLLCSSFPMSISVFFFFLYFSIRLFSSFSRGLVN